ncbi:MAG: hypothetical protein ACLS9A_09485 [Clostridia bacterium]
MDIFYYHHYEGLPVWRSSNFRLSCIFSPVVIEEAKLIEDTIYIIIKKKYWAEQALQFKETQRKDKSLIAERDLI